MPETVTPNFRSPAPPRQVVATPEHWHALQTMLACAMGKDVMVRNRLRLVQTKGLAFDRLDFVVRIPKVAASRCRTSTSSWTPTS